MAAWVGKVVAAVQLVGHSAGGWAAYSWVVARLGMVEAEEAWSEEDFGVALGAGSEACLEVAAEEGMVAGSEERWGGAARVVKVVGSVVFWEEMAGVTTEEALAEWLEKEKEVLMVERLVVVWGVDLEVVVWEVTVKEVLMEMAGWVASTGLVAKLEADTGGGGKRGRRRRCWYTG